MKAKENKKSAKELYRYKLLIDSIEKYEAGKPCNISFHWCSNTITWLWKWRKITEDEMKSLCNRMINVMEDWKDTDRYKMW